MRSTQVPVYHTLLLFKSHTFWTFKLEINRSKYQINSFKWRLSSERKNKNLYELYSSLYYRCTCCGFNTWKIWCEREWLEHQMMNDFFFFFVFFLSSYDMLISISPIERWIYILDPDYKNSATVFTLESILSFKSIWNNFSFESHVFVVSLHFVWCEFGTLVFDVDRNKIVFFSPRHRT